MVGRARVAASLATCLVMAVAGEVSAEQQPSSPPPGPRVEIRVEPASVALGDTFSVEVTISGGASSSGSRGAQRVTPGNVSLPSGSPFELVRQLSAHFSMQMSQQGGAMVANQQQRIRLLIRATQAGQHQVAVTVGGKVHRDPAAVVTVTAAAGGSI